MGLMRNVPSPNGFKVKTAVWISPHDWQVLPSGETYEHQRATHANLVIIRGSS